jgi:hypothetical protein
MHLETLTSGSTKISLSMLGRKVVKETIEVGWELSCRLFETKHKLIVLGFPLLLTIGLHVRSVVFEDLHCILGYADFLSIRKGLVVGVIKCR